MTIRQNTSVTPAAGSVIPVAFDWQAFSKTLVLELGFIGCTVAVLTGHGSPDIIQLVWALGGTLGVLKLSDTAANVVNVRSYLGNQQAQASGVFPQASNTPLVTTVPTNGVPHDTSAPAAVPPQQP